MNPPRGMRDFLPADKARRERLLAIIRERYRAHGFDEIETPAHTAGVRRDQSVGGVGEIELTPIMKWMIDRGGDFRRYSQSVLLTIAAAVDGGTLTRAGFIGNPVGFRAVKLIAEAAAAVPKIRERKDGAAVPLACSIDNPDCEACQ